MYKNSKYTTDTSANSFLQIRPKLIQNESRLNLSTKLHTLYTRILNKTILRRMFMHTFAYLLFAQKVVHFNKIKAWLRKGECNFWIQLATPYVLTSKNKKNPYKTLSFCVIMLLFCTKIIHKHMHVHATNVSQYQLTHTHTYVHKHAHLRTFCVELSLFGKCYLARFEGCTRWMRNLTGESGWRIACKLAVASKRGLPQASLCQILEFVFFQNGQSLRKGRQKPVYPTYFAATACN